MPHFGLMDADRLGPVGAARERARLHVRAGRRRLREGKISAGIVTLFDALLHAMEWVMLTRPPDPGFPYREGMALGREREIFAYLEDAGLTDGYDFPAFCSLVDAALEDDLDPGAVGPAVTAEFDRVMTRLGILPFDEADLPPEDPATF